MIVRWMAVAWLSSLAPLAVAGEVWDSLWRTADQRGAAFLAQGDAAAAARTFSDPRRKAYAELQAGDPAAAASRLAAFDDGDSHYNRGNALARTGDLQGALDAYEAAIKHDPKNADATHNRDVVAKALTERKREQGQRSNSQQPGSGEGKSMDGDQGEPDQDSPGKSGKEDTQAPSGSKNKESSEKTARPNPGNPGGAKVENEASGGQAPAVTSSEKSHAESIVKSTTQSPTKLITKPPTEKQLAQEQWLRSIPDDPGGLLRRKFLIEHMLRQQRAQR